MKNLVHVLSLSAIALTLASGAAYASDERDCQQIMGFSGHVKRDLFPSNCEQSTTAIQVGGKTRGQVDAELAAAQTAGQIVVSFAAKPAREVRPGEYAQATASLAQQDGSKSREQVKAELAQAQTTGDIVVSFAAKPARVVRPGEYPEAATSLAQENAGSTTSAH